MTADRQKYKQDWYRKNKEQEKKRRAKHHKNHKQHAYDSITSGSIIDREIWNKWCDDIKRKAEEKHPYSDDFTSDVMFEMMVQGCFYCDEVAMTIDRVDSKLEHTPENCVGSCPGCNNSKGAADPDTFIRKAYYRARGTYYDDDTDIWFVHKQKPYTSGYNKKVPFELTKDEWEKLIVGKCAYCHRSPTTWFGVDRIDPPKGYILGNIASCCWDCNLDKLEDDVETMRARNERIAQRMDDGELVIDGHEKVILHRGNHPSSKTVCANGKVYENQKAAARENKMNKTTFYRRINDGKDPDIFAVTKEFYEEYKDSIEDITKNMFIAFDHFYTNMNL
jgi:5-methylcytosine-specific restriction endonuclease McrA